MPTIESMRIDGEKLRALRQGAFMTRDELAKKTGIHRDSIGRMERGEVTEPRMQNFRKLAAALGVEPQELLH